MSKSGPMINDTKTEYEPRERQSPDRRPDRRYTLYRHRRASIAKYEEVFWWMQLFRFDQLATCSRHSSLALFTGPPRFYVADVSFEGELIPICIQIDSAGETSRSCVDLAMIGDPINNDVFFSSIDRFKNVARRGFKNVLPLFTSFVLLIVRRTGDESSIVIRFV